MPLIESRLRSCWSLGGCDGKGRSAVLSYVYVHSIEGIGLVSRGVAGICSLSYSGTSAARWMILRRIFLDVIKQSAVGQG